MSRIRNFSIIAHVDHGKSTLADRMLEMTGTIEPRRMQEQVLDRMELERERGITIKMAPVRMVWEYHANRRKDADLTQKDAEGDFLYKDLTYKIRGSRDLEIKRVVYDTARNTSALSASSLRESAGVSNQIEGGPYILNLIDTPGHVDFSYEVSRALSAVEGVVLLVDATQGVEAQTLSVLSTAKGLNLVILPVVSKIDAPNARVGDIVSELSLLLGCPEEHVLKASGKTGEGVREILDAVVERIPEPRASGKKSQALVFDFGYSDHRGVIVYARVFGGALKKGDELRLMAAGAAFTALEVGVLTPEEMPCPELREGEIGYIVTGIKKPGVASVGDTVTAAHGGAPALSGYRAPTPVIWASVYPESQDDLPLLRQSLERLRLSDSSLSYDEESSGIMGKGFRCGFLGMLHLEIVIERLRREFNLVLVVTQPTTVYEVTRMDGSVEEIYSPARFPDEGTAKRIREMWRGFFDSLKSISSGFASLSYELTGLRNADVVRLDILVAEEPVPAFARIVSRRRVQTEAEAMVEKLEKLLPRQLFVLKIQARAMGRIIAARRVSALRKDVTGYLYGGDVTRKMKLLEKQKRGKKKMLARGKIEIPHDVFLKVVRES